MYNQGLGTTADSEHTMLTSLFPLENGMVFQRYYDNEWYDIFSEVKSEGYYTSFMHPNVSDFWNRYAVYNKGYKIDEYNDITQFDNNGEWAGGFFSDEQFFIQAAQKMADYEEPFCSLLVSVSTHIPYELEGIKDLEKKLTIDTSHIAGHEEMSKYLLSCNFVDYSFGRFMEELEKAGLLDNSIIVVVGDHGAGLQGTDMIKLIYEENNSEYNENIEKLLGVSVPFGIRIPNVDGFVIHEAKAKMDIKPTILDLLGAKDTFSLGESIFTDKDYAFIKGIGFVTKDVYCIDGEYINRKTNEAINPNKHLIFLDDQMKNEITLSDTIIKSSLSIQNLFQNSY